jgi:hypothetical protein
VSPPASGGYCLGSVSALPVASPECEADPRMCVTSDECIYTRKAGPGRWLMDPESRAYSCVGSCDHPLVFCDKGRCQATLGCSWFVKMQAPDDECFCRTDPGFDRAVGSSRPVTTPRPVANDADMFLIQYPVSWVLAVFAVTGLFAIAYHFVRFNFPRAAGRKGSVRDGVVP